jgi:uncharacterized membrane protein
MTEQSLILKIFLGLAASGLTLGLLAICLPKGQANHRLTGRLAQIAGITAGLGGLFWALPINEQYPSLCLLLSLYLGIAGQGWTRAAGPLRIERAITGMALIGSLASVLTALSVFLGFRAETLSREGAPLALLFGMIGMECARRNLSRFENLPALALRQKLHGMHMTGALIALGSAMFYAAADRLGLDPWLAALLAVLGLLPLIMIAMRRSG